MYNQTHMEMFTQIVELVSALVLAAATVVLAWYTKVLAGHTKELNELEKKERTRSDLSRALDTADEVVLIDPRAFVKALITEDRVRIKRLWKFSKYISDDDVKKRLREFINIVEDLEQHVGGHSDDYVLNKLGSMQSHLKRTVNDWREQLKEL